jgi:fructokinase
MDKGLMVVFGEVLWDLFPEGPRMGGAPSNFACHAARLGQAVSLLSAVGEDELGERALWEVSRLGVAVDLVGRMADLRTGTVEVLAGPEGPRYRIAAPAAWDAIAWNEATERVVAGARLFYFGTLAQRATLSRETLRRCLEVASEHGVRRFLDVNLRTPYYDASIIRESVERCTVLKLSDEELDTVLESCGVGRGGTSIDALQALRDRFGLEAVVLTRGPKGALLFTQDRVVEQSGFPVEVVDTVGAGDAFSARLAVGLVSGEEIEKTVEEACRLASRVCSRRGAVPDL